MIYFIENVYIYLYVYVYVLIIRVFDMYEIYVYDILVCVCQMIVS